MSNWLNMDGLDTLKNGYQFDFDVNGHQVSVWGSGWNGKEIIKVDGSVVSEMRSITRMSVHRFELDSNHYEVELNMKSILNGELECTVIENGVHFETQVQRAMKKEVTKKSFFKDFFIWMLVGGVIGFVSSVIVGFVAGKV
ncbi:MAG: hypothetical protein ACPGUD_12595 [Parashewanella sp.]